MHCVVLVTLARERKRERTTVQADSQGHTSHYHELMSRVWPVNAYFLRIFRQCSVINRRKKSLSGYWFCRRKLRENISNLLRKTLTRTRTCLTVTWHHRNLVRYYHSGSAQKSTFDQEGSTTERGSKIHLRYWSFLQPMASQYFQFDPSHQYLNSLLRSLYLINRGQRI